MWPNDEYTVPEIESLCVRILVWAVTFPPCTPPQPLLRFRTAGSESGSLDETKMCAVCYRCAHAKEKHAMRIF